MNLRLILAISVLMLQIKAQTGLTFTITNVTGSGTITCTHPAINLISTSNFTAPVNYSWTNASSTLSGSNVNLTSAGVYTVSAFSGTLSTSQTLSIGINTLVPTSMLTPTLLNINPTTVATISMTAVNPTVNITHYIYAPVSGTFSAQSYTAIYAPASAGVYTHCLVNNINGCSTCENFTVTSIQGFPTYSVASTIGNYTLGCGSKSFCTIGIINASSTPTPGGSLSYTVLAPGTTFTPQAPPGGILSTSPIFTVTVPGTWTVIVRDNTSGLITQVPVSIIQNTIPPYVKATAGRQILDCSYTTTILFSVDTITRPAPVTYNWVFPGGSLSSYSFPVSANLANPTSTFINSFTLTVTDLNNACKASSVTIMYQNLFPPIPVISQGNNIIDCDINYPALLVNQSVSGIPASSGFPIIYPVQSSWYSPSSPVVANTATLYVTVPGAYTMTATDLNNGCQSSKIVGICTGLQSNTIKNSHVSIFPNPGNGLLTINTEGLLKEGSIEIYNALGMLVKKQILNSETSSIDLQNEANGIYSIRVLENNKLVYTSKLLKH